MAGGAVAGQGAALQPSSRLFRGGRGEASAPEPLALGGAWQSQQGPCTPRPRLQFPPDLCPLLPRFTPVRWGPHTDQVSLKGWGAVVGAGAFPTATTDQGQGFQQSNSQKPSLFIFHSCRSTSLQKLRMSGFWRGRRIIWAQTLPEIVFAQLLRLVSSEKQFNNKLYRIRNVQKCQGGCWLVSCLPLGARVMPVSPVQRSWGWRGAPDSSQGEDRPARPAEVCQGAGAWVCVQVPWPQQAPWLSSMSPSCLYVRPLKVFMQV